MTKDAMPLILSLRVPFYPVRHSYDRRILFPMEDTALTDAYAAALRKEIESSAGEYDDCLVKAVHIGGGIAGHVFDEALGTLLKDMHSWFHFSDDAQVTLKIHPGMFSVETLSACRRGGINRLSVDYVTSDPFESEEAGRFLPPDAMDTTMMVLSGASSPLTLSFDVLAGLPGQSPESLRRTLDQVKRYGASEIALHMLEIVSGTSLASRRNELALSHSPRHHLPDPAQKQTLLKNAADWMAENGFLLTVPDMEENMASPIIPDTEDTKASLAAPDTEGNTASLIAPDTEGNMASPIAPDTEYTLTFTGQNHKKIQPYRPGRYSLPGSGSLYHTLRMTDCPLLGFGLGAVTKAEGVKAENTWDMKTYLKSSDDPSRILAHIEPLKNHK